MPAVWTYPWNLAQEGVDEACERLAARGIDALNVASHYHSVRSMNPRSPDDLFTSYPGGCYFDPDPDRFADTPIDPLPNDVPGFEDPIAEIVAAADDHGLDVNAWTVCTHNSRLGAEHPEYRIRSAFGDAHDHAFCPSHPAVRAYFAAVVAALADRGVASVQLESVGFASAFHEHGWNWGHDKRQVLTADAEEVLLSQCFCEGCRAAAADHPVDLDEARTLVRRLVRDSFADPHADPPAFAALAREHRVLRDLFDFRADVVTEFVAGLADAAGDADLSYYPMELHLGVEPDDLWPAGVDVGRLADHLDRTLCICYESDPAVAVDRIRTLRRMVDCTVDAGVTLDPALIERESELHALVDAVRPEIDGFVSVYHHGLATDAQLDWIERAFAE